MDGGNWNSGYGFSGNGGINPSNPQGPNNPGNFSNNFGIGVDNDTKLSRLKHRSYTYIYDLETKNLERIKYLETQAKLIANEQNRAFFIESLRSDKLNKEFLDRTTSITRYIFSLDATTN